MKIYAIFDKKLNGITDIFPAPTDGFATREIQNSIRPESKYAKFPTDFCIYQLCEYDEHTLEVMPAKKLIIELTALVGNQE